MKIFHSALVLWLLVHQASATFWGIGGLLNLFKPPQRCDNICTPGQEKGLDWDGLNIGVGFNLFAGLNFLGFTCQKLFDFKTWTGKFQDKCIVGLLQHKGKQFPSISADKGFSIDKFHITVEKNVDIEFEYKMPGGAICKDIQPCTPGGSIITNTQCGGATSVSFHIPNFFEKLLQCKFAIHKIIFLCGPPKFTKPVPSLSLPAPSNSASTTIIPGQSSSVVIPGTSTTLTVPGQDTTTTLPGQTTSVVIPGQSSTVVVPGGSTTIGVPGGSTSVVVPGQSTSVIVPGTTTTIVNPGGSTTIVNPGTSTSIINPGGSTTLVVPGETTTLVGPSGSSTVIVPPNSVTPSVSLSTSTVFTTQIITVTSCGPEVPDCPASSGPAIVTKTIPISTTLCPITVTPSVPAGPSVTPGQPGNSQPGVPSNTQPGTPGTTGQPGEPGNSQPGVPSNTQPGTPGTTGQPGEPGNSQPGVPSNTQPGTPGTTGQPGEPGNSQPGVPSNTQPGTPGTTGQPGEPGNSQPGVPSNTQPGTPGTTGQPGEPGNSQPGVPGTTTKPGEPGQPGNSQPGVPGITTKPGEPGQPGQPGNSQPGAPGSTGGVSPSQSVPGQPSGPIPTSDCPDVVPKCINTWLEMLPKCSSNSDISCFCPSAQFTDSVIKCIAAWGGDNKAVQKAISYFTGICSAHIPQNPEIIAQVPPYIASMPAPPPPAKGDSGAPGVPYTTVTVSQVITPTPGAAPSTINTQVAVPQLGFSTGGSPAQPSVELIQGPAPAPASPTGPSGVSPDQQGPVAGAPGASTLATIPAPGRPSATGPQQFVGAAGALTHSSKLLYSAIAAGFFAVQLL